jgi:BirA family biotin operon repressor/biotin-[acetyl-CoA-carboxylase] ligase
LQTADPTASSFDLAALRQALGERAVRFDADAVGECDSTNNQLLARAEAGIASGAVLIADRQTAGRGRRGRVWFSAPGCSLTFSLLWRFGEDSKAPTALSLVIGLALARAFDAIGATGSMLKWPNDVQYQGRKVAGILVELVPSRLRTAVIGIGLNLRLPPGLPAELLGTTSSLDQMMSVVPAREVILGAILESLAATLDRYGSEGFVALRESWSARHAYSNKPVRILSDLAPSRDGDCIGVDDEGALLVRFDARVERLISGEISLRPA